jgi:hypothetical protein
LRDPGEKATDARRATIITRENTTIRVLIFVLTCRNGTKRRDNTKPAMIIRVATTTETTDKMQAKREIAAKVVHVTNLATLPINLINTLRDMTTGITIAHTDFI